MLSAFFGFAIITFMDQMKYEEHDVMNADKPNIQKTIFNAY